MPINLFSLAEVILTIELRQPSCSGPKGGEQVAQPTKAGGGPRWRDDVVEAVSSKL